MLSRVLHLAVDAALISTILAGIKRTTGLQPAVKKIENKEIRGYFEKYLAVGEWILDTTIVLMSNSSYFERRR
ncbi:hypothetical protein EC973_000942 [Apophysomyces ossiformis]|uniref:DUF1748-domain-containing protein n=1 Tax=Apophysomyces ossiformis TaxID=679940 RepID=A0A8H7ENW0_9FUNG|nr:hypothetical protein EC973_000942 [Apophysomyces ossiformis]